MSNLAMCLNHAQRSITDGKRQKFMHNMCISPCLGMQIYTYSFKAQLNNRQKNRKALYIKGFSVFSAILNYSLNSSLTNSWLYGF